MLPRKQLLQTRGGRLEYVLCGGGRPVWLLFNGAGLTLESWRGLFPGIEQLGTVFAWNRFGLGRSDPPRAAQTGSAVVSSLRELLGYCGLKPPYVLVAHSLGGLHANLFARLYPEEVEGVLFLEATHPGEPDRGRGHESRLAQTLTRLFPVPGRWLRGNLHAELEWAQETSRQVDAAGAFPPVPVFVLSGGKPPPPWLANDEAQRLRRIYQQGLARLSPQGRQLTAPNSGHFPQRTEPQLVLQAMGELVQALRR